MNSNLLIVDFFMEIKKNLSRFLSILLIVALGVAFFSGVRATKPDMQKTIEGLYDESNLMDLRIVSTLGMSSDDLRAVQQLGGLQDAIGVYTADVLIDGDENGQVLRLRSNHPQMNQITVTEGRLPERQGECLIDRLAAEHLDIQVGDVLNVKSGTSEDIKQVLTVSKFIVTGIGDSPLYVWKDRDTTSIGNGSVAGFMIVQPEIFLASAYSEIDITIAGAKELNSFSKEYEQLVEKTIARIGEIKDGRAMTRYNEVSEKSQAELIKAESELAKAQQQMDEAKAALESAQTDLDATKLEINTKLQEVLTGQTTVEEQEQALQESAVKLEAAKVALDVTRADLAAKQAAMEAGVATLEKSRDELVQAWDGWSEKNTAFQKEKSSLTTEELALSEKKILLYEKQTELLELKGAVDSNKSSEPEALNGEGFDIEAYDALEDMVSTDTPIPSETPGETVGPTEGEDATDIRALEREIAQLEAEIVQKEEALAPIRKAIEATQAELDTTYAELEKRGTKLEEEASLYASSKTELTQALGQLALGEADYAKQKATLEAGVVALEAAKAAIANGQTTISETQTQIATAEAQLALGWDEYESSLLESQQKFKEATDELNDKKRQLMRMEVPEWNVLDRSYIESVEGYAQDADRIGAIGDVFPLIFFLVAALVSLTSITRMVEEQRTQIGVLKALGYEKYEIAAKYICYAAFASLLGGVFGLVIGQLTLPRVVINAYSSLYYTLPETRTPLHLGYSVSSVLLAVLCTSIAALGACYRQLSAMPAQLMRPEASRTGRRVLLEKISFVWKKLNFSKKAAVRNMFRYKKRFFMTIFGIAACTALLLVGFGIRDSVNAISDEQFGSIQKYGAEFVIGNDNVLPMAQLEETLNQDPEVKSYTYINKTALEVGFDKKEESAILTVVENTQDIHKYIGLKERTSKKKLQIPEEGIIITEKLAKLLEVQRGDPIYLMDSDNYKVEVEVAAITENYFRHYIYMSANQYEMLYGSAPSYNEVLILPSKNAKSSDEEISKKYLELDAVSSVVHNAMVRDTVDNTVKNMNVVILVLIIAAALLAFVVLYNLNYINITERRRELATLKVLGFYNKEVTMYVLRENIVLTLMGIVIGLILGIFLHRFVIVTAEMDLIMFGRTIGVASYLFSAWMTVLFAAFINCIMHCMLKKIDMVESLKSVE